MRLISCVVKRICHKNQWRIEAKGFRSCSMKLSLRNYYSPERNDGGITHRLRSTFLHNFPLPTFFAIAVATAWHSLTLLLCLHKHCLTHSLTRVGAQKRQQLTLHFRLRLVLQYFPLNNRLWLSTSQHLEKRRYIKRKNVVSQLLIYALVVFMHVMCGAAW